MSASPDLNRLLLNYRECYRHVWNAYFQPLDDGWHEFINVEHSLFEGLVLSQLHNSDQPAHRPEGIVAGIQVVPQIPPIGHLSVFYVEPPNVGTGTVQWVEGQMTPGEVDLRYAGFFDWRNDSDPIELRYVRVRVMSSHQPEFLGKDMLIEFQNVRFTQAK